MAMESEACRCHGPLWKHLQLSQYRTSLALEQHYGSGVSVCPMAGKVVPEMVTGRLETLLNDIFKAQEPFVNSHTRTVLLSD